MYIKLVYNIIQGQFDTLGPVHSFHYENHVSPLDFDLFLCMKRAYSPLFGQHLE